MPEDTTRTSGSSAQPHAEAPEVHPVGHGTSVAAWTSTIGVSIGAFIVCLALIFMWVPVIVVGAVIIVLAGLSAPVLARAGYGEKSHDREATGGPRSVS
ncbi:HGxxPAAW family protein [Aquipuribacter sp. MA13-6]|uniref:HGxxPAAW family protein n=1 Tax=unclassified Aquipuribacter TaxID=2635084 RepID=UPI003EEB2C23